MASKERRQHVRHALRHDALVVARGMNPAPCEVADLCEQGMWLENVASRKLLDQLLDEPDTPVEVHLFVAGSGSEVHTRVMGEVRRLQDPHMGVQFFEPMPDLVRLLLDTEPTRYRRVILEESERQHLWRTFRNDVQQLLYPLLDSFNEHALEGIQRRLEKAAIGKEINQLKDARLMLVQARDPMARDFLRRWQVFRSAMQGEEEGGISREDLRIVDKALFEDWLELQMVATRLASYHRNALFQLHQLLSQLGLRDLDDRSNPLAPIPLCQCLHYAVFRAGVGDEVKPVLYHAFEAALWEHWPKGVETLMERLQAGGLRMLGLENLPTTWAPTRQRSRGFERSNQGEQADSEHAEGAGRKSPRKAPLVRGTLLRLVGLQRDPQRRDTPTEGVPPELLEQLQPLEDELAQQLGEGVPGLTAVLERIAANHQKLAGQLNSDAWDLVALVDQLFAPLQRLEKLPENLRQQLDQLRLPVFKVLLEEPEFLDDSEHPARRVINHLMRLCLADRGSSRNLERTVNQVVTELVEASHVDGALLGRVAERLQALVERQEQAFVRNAERIAKTFEGRQRLVEARRAVQRRIDMRLSGREVPIVLLDLLASGWEQLMVLAILKEGGESQSLTEYFNVVEQIQSWLGREGDSEELAFERELESPALLELVERELVTTGEPGRWKEVVRHLREQLHDEERTDYVWLASYPPGESPVTSQPPALPEDSRWVSRAQRLQVGDWISEQDENGEARRMRLVWVGEGAYRFVFLTARGLHEIEYDLEDVVERFRRGEIERVEHDQVPFVDQSLYDIVQDLYREMAFRATHDPLTGCIQRHEFQKQLARLIEHSAAQEDSGALITLDIDQFAVVNASYGTKAGDAMLREVGVLLSDLKPGGNCECLVARLGSNEFAVAVYPLSVEDSLDFADLLRRRFAGHGFRYQGSEYRGTVSLGVAPIDEEAAEASELFNRANLALKAAKEGGGNCVRFAGAIQHQQQQELMSWVNRIDQALEDNTLTLRAQRIVSVGSEQDSGFFEILLGLRDGQGEAISPEPFMRAAEQSRRSAQVDRWVVEHTLAWMQNHPDVVEGLEGLNINLSGASVSDDAFLGHLEDLVRRQLVPPEKLCFEVTETAAIANLHYTADFMRELKRLGCRFALDDFGTGLSSYAYLQKLPVDFVKIDGVFVRDLADNLTNYAMVRSINELAHFMGMQTMAEYVEDLEVLNALREVGVDYAQGFGLSRPKPLETLIPKKDREHG